MPEQFQRATAYKFRIGDILRGKPILNEEKFSFLELGNKQIIRVNIVANVIDRYESEGASNFTRQNEIESTSEVARKKKYSTLTMDDASGQIRIKIFGEDVEKFREIEQGNTVAVIGTLRFFNNEIYIQPEIIRQLDPRYLLIRKLELEKETPKEVKKEEIKAVKDHIIDMIKLAESEGGIDTDKLIMEIKASPDIINQEIQKLLEEGLVYEPRPGKIRYLG